MTDENYLCALPTEIILNIFTHLSVKDLVNCRRVSIRFKQIADSCCRSETLWQKYCKRDFSSVYKIARYKSKPGLLWCNLYRSLTLWSKLDLAREEYGEFACTSIFKNEILNCIILKNGLIGVHTQSAIVYYNIDTLEKANRSIVKGTYLRYDEIDDMIIILNYNLQLIITHKILQNHRPEGNIVFYNVKCLLLVDKFLYFVNLNNDIFVCDLEKSTNKQIGHSNDGIMCLSFCHNKLHLLTYERTVYACSNGNLTLEYKINSETHLINQLAKYNLLETLDWRIYNHWMFVLNLKLPTGPLRDIIKVLVYGEVVFVGSIWGVLRIYYAPYTDDKFDIYDTEPIRQFNFMDRSVYPTQDNPLTPIYCPIIQIDVCEIEDGHVVLIGMPNKVAVLKFNHSFKRTASVAMLPCDIPKMKTLKIDEGK